MTKNQIIFLLNSISKNLNTIISLEELSYISFPSGENVFPDRETVKFRFNHDKEVLEIIRCRNISIKPKHSNYETLLDSDNKPYYIEYLSDKSGELLSDFYSYDSILMIGLKGRL